MKKIEERMKRKKEKKWRMKVKWKEVRQKRAKHLNPKGKDSGGFSAESSSSAGNKLKNSH